MLRYPFVTAKDPRARGLPRLMPTGRPGADVPRMALFAADGRRGPAFPLPEGALASTALERSSTNSTTAAASVACSHAHFRGKYR